MKNWTVHFLLLCFAFLIVTVNAQEGGYGSGSGVAWGEADFSDPNTDLTSMGSQDIVDNFDALVENDRLGDSKLNQEELGKALRQKGYSGIGDVNLAGSDATISGDTLTVNGNTIDLGTFRSGKHSIDTSGDTVLIDGNEVIGADNVHLVDDVVTIDKVEYFSSGAVTIANGENVRVFGDRVEADRAGSIVINRGSTANNVRVFSGSLERFSVEQADVVNRDCLYFFNVKDAVFELFEYETRWRASNVGVSVRDCEGRELDFVAEQNGTLIVRGNEYSVARGNLSFSGHDFVEWVKASDGILVLMDEYSGFACMTIMPGGAYFYSSKTDKRMDFSVESPLYGIDYRLCIKKDSSQSFSVFDGIIDIVANMNQLDGTVNYHRYPLRNNVLAGVILEPIYQGFLNPRMRMQLDTHNIYSTNMTVQVHSADRTVSKTYASNYITIRESPGFKSRNTRTWTKINSTLQKEELTDNFIMNYNGMSIIRNVVIHKNTMILPQGHDLISREMDGE